jgi:branched-chain amino acid transport system ATP-binding protein
LKTACPPPDEKSLMAEDCILETTGLVKEFRGFVAVNDVNLKVKARAYPCADRAERRRQDHLLQPADQVPRTDPRHDPLQRQDITRESPEKIARRGIVRSFQISAVFPHLTVLENVRIALQRKLGTSFHFWKSERSLDALNGRAMELLAAVGLEEHAGMVTVEMPYGRKRALEIATTLALDPELMLLDEPTQGMGHEDVDRVMELIKKVSANRTILMVEHNMKVVAGISDTLTVLARGAVLAEGPYAEVAANPLVIEAYMGTEVANWHRRPGTDERHRIPARLRPARLLRRVARAARHGFHACAAASAYRCSGATAPDAPRRCAPSSA